MEHVKIKQSWYFTAGRKYGWETDGLDARGVGLNRDVLYDNEELDVFVEGVKYHLDCKKAIDFINRYRSFYKTDRGTVIGVISKDILV